jgi:hypothetical protein
MGGTFGPGSGFGSFASGINRGVEDVQTYDYNKARNQAERNYANQGTMQNWANRQGAQQLGYQDSDIPQIQVGDPVIAKLYSGAKNAVGNAYSKAAGLFTGKNQAPNQSTQQGPPAPAAAQNTIPQGSNIAQSAPGPSSSNSAAPGHIGASGNQTLDSETAPVEQSGINRAEGGAIPGRRGAQRMRGKAGKTPPPRALPTANGPGASDTPVSPPRNTEPGAGISNQDPMLANGGGMMGGLTKVGDYASLIGNEAQQGMNGQGGGGGMGLPGMDNGGAVASPFTGGISMGAYNAVERDADGNFIQKAIKKPGQLHRDLGVPQGEKIPKSKIKAAEKGGGKVAKRAQLADTMSKFKNGGKVNVPQMVDEEPAPQPNAQEKNVSNDGQRNRLGRTIKRFDNGGAASAPPWQTEAQNEGENPNPTGPKLPRNTFGDPSLLDDLSRKNAKDPSYAGTTPPYVGQGASPPQSSMASSAAGRPGAQQIPVIDNREATNRIRSGGYDANGNPAGPAMVDTESPGVMPAPMDRSSRNSGPSAGVGGSQQTAGQSGIQQGPPAPAGAAPIDFSKVDLDHTDIPNTSTDEWNGLKRTAALQLVAKGVPVSEAKIQVDNQISQYQHQNFMQYVTQAAALDAAGNKKGAMAAMRTAYQYFPTGHDMHFGLGQDGTIVGYGVNEKTGQPIQNGAVRLDQQAIHGILTHFQNPENFVNEGLRMQEAANQTAIAHKATIPLAQARVGYFNERNPTSLAVAETRAEAAGARFANQDHEARFQQEFRDLPDHGGALAAAAQIERLYTQKFGQPPDEQARQQIAGEVRQMYDPSTDPAQRAQWQQQRGISQNNAPAPSPVRNRNEDPSLTWNALNGQ